MRCRQIIYTYKRRRKRFEDCVELAIRDLEVYVHGSEKILIQAARGDTIDGLEAASVLKRSKKEK